MGLKVIAEGIEDNRQKEDLAKWGCDYFQGYLFSRPVPLYNAESFIKKYI